MTFDFSQLQVLAAFITLFIGGWWTITLRTRTTEEKVRIEMERQFWINHSVDLPYAIGNRSPDATESRLVVKGFELYEDYWWLQIGSRTDPYILANPKEAYEQFKRRLEAFLAKLRYLLYRNLWPYADVRMNIKLVVQAENCRIRIWEIEERTEHGMMYEGLRVGEALPTIVSVNRLWDGLYKIHIDTSDYNEAAKAMQQLKSSKFVEP